MKIIKRDKSHKSSFDKSEIENLNKNQADILKISPKPKMISSGTYEISSVQLEDLVSLYIDENNNNLLYENFELLGGTQGIMEKLKTSCEHGIENTDLRQEEFGINKIFEEPPKPFLKFLKESLSELMIIILLSAAVIQIIIGLTITNDKKTGWLDGASVLFAVFVVVSVESFTNWQKEQKFYELNNLKSSGTVFKTIRGNIIVDLKAEELLVGDILLITMGEIMPADLLLIEGNEIKIDESSLTGESKPVTKETYENCILNTNESKKNISPIILSGTDCIGGNGKAMVIAVGERSTKGKIRRMVDNSKDEKITPLQEKLEVLAKRISTFAIFAGATTFLCLTIRLIFVYISDYRVYKGWGLVHGFHFRRGRKDCIHNHHTQTMDRVHPKSYLFPRLLENFMITTVIITIALPEGLPMAVALTLAFSIKKLMDQNNLVRKMHSCETMGGADYILTDKTGTLTTNELNVVKIVCPGREINLTDEKNIDGITIGDKVREEPTKYFQNEKFWNLLRTSLSINVDCHINMLAQPNINGDTEECNSKNKTDNALINFLYRIKSPVSEILSKYEKEDKKQIPFDSNKKRMTTLVKENNGNYRLYTKGGSENIKKFCKYYIDSETGEKKELTHEILQELEEKIEICNNDMLRTIYICYKDIEEKDFTNIDEENDKNDLILLAVFGIRDIIRKGVREAVLKCKEASINIIMVTGDNIQTAHSIAKECNIIESTCLLKNDYFETEEDNLSHPPIEITGDLFYQIIGGLICSTCGLSSNDCKCPKTYAEAEQLSKKLNMPIQKLKNDTIKNKENFRKIVSKLRIMARSKPIHKYALVVGLKELNYIVAVTGDGTNDAPALSKSDVGFSMFDGTDIAKNSSDIILMNNNFSSIVSAIKYGRNIIDNLRKFIQFQLVINLTVCSFIVVCSCIGSQTPIKSIQMLWIDLIMDSLATLTLTTEPPHDGLLKRKPTKRYENIITSSMIKHVSLQTILQFTILIMIYLFGPNFIQEQNLARIAENQVILKCFGVLPGEKTDPTKIIYGIQTFWPNDISIKKEMIDNEMCKDYMSGTLSNGFKIYTRNQGAPVQLTMIFNIFVLYTLLNQLNCRVVDGSKNIFARLKNNRLFIFIEIFEFTIQYLIIEFWNVVFKATRNGLTLNQWGICILLSSLTLLLDFILKIF